MEKAIAKKPDAIICEPFSPVIYQSLEEAQNFFERGYESVRMAYEYLTKNGKVKFGKFEDSSVVLITEENAEDYEKALWKAVRTKGTAWK